MTNQDINTLTVLALYVLPALIAAVRGHHNQNAIAVLNIALGWTILGWIAALVWAVSAINPALRRPGLSRAWRRYP